MPTPILTYLWRSGSDDRNAVSICIVGVRLGFISLDPLCTPVPNAMPVMAVGTATLDSSVAPLTAMVVYVYSASVLLQPI